MKNVLATTLRNRNNSLNIYSLLMVSLLCCLGLTKLNAQDVIIKKDGSEIEAKVLEITSTTIKYKRFDMQDGPAYNIDKSEVFMVKYRSGQKDVFNKNTITPENNVTTKKPSYKNNNDKKNAIGVSPIMLIFDFDNKLGYVEYERLIGDRVSIGGRILHTEKYNWPEQESATGAGIFVRKYFNKGSGLKGFYIGSSLDILSVEWSDSWMVSVPNNGYYEYKRVFEYGSGIAIAVTSQFGYKVNIGKTFYIEPSASLGFYNSYTSSDLDSYNELGVIAAPALTFGCRF